MFGHVRVIERSFYAIMVGVNERIPSGGQVILRADVNNLSFFHKVVLWISPRILEELNCLNIRFGCAIAEERYRPS